MEIRNKFSDILVEIETTGQYNAKDMPKSLPEALRAYACLNYFVIGVKNDKRNYEI